VTGAKAQWW